MSTEAPSKSLSGKGLMQSVGEWSARNDALSAALSELVRTHGPADGGLGLDVGCQNGALTDAWERLTDLHWTGIDPGIAELRQSEAGLDLHPGWAHELPFPDAHFDCAIFANVYEHVAPELREPSLREMLRVLKPGGVLVGQLPNPYFPIESHSRLPFMGCLPPSAAARLLEALPCSVGARLLLGDDPRSAQPRRRHRLRTDRAAQLQLSVRGHPAARALGGAFARASHAGCAMGVAVRAAAPSLTERGASGSTRRSSRRAPLPRAHAVR